MTAPLGVYVHWPFCAAKCPYCDFNSHVRDHVDEDGWRDALLTEMAHYAIETDARAVVSLFFGGGTPSLMAPATAAAVIERTRRLWPCADDMEVTLEANPGSVETHRLADFKAAGVNRVSIGVQALDDAALRFLGRRHSAAEARRAAQAAARLFDRFSIDMIYARPGQTVAGWRAELADALTLAGDHMSAYQLTIEPGAPFHARHARGEFALPDEDVAAELYESTADMLDGAGLALYEVSNHARGAGACRHNLVYWRYDDYIGLGPGAHGRYRAAGARWATTNIRAPEAWLAAVRGAGRGARETSRVAPDLAAREMMLMGLRLTRGLGAADMQTRTGRDLFDVIDRARMDTLRKRGLVDWDGARLACTPAGRLRLNAVLAYLARDPIKPVKPDRAPGQNRQRNSAPGRPLESPSGWRAAPPGRVRRRPRR